MRERQSERCSNSLHLPAKRPKKIGDPAAAAHTAAPRPGLPAPRAQHSRPSLDVSRTVRFTAVDAPKIHSHDCLFVREHRIHRHGDIRRHPPRRLPHVDASNRSRAPARGGGAVPWIDCWPNGRRGFPDEQLIKMKSRLRALRGADDAEARMATRRRNGLRKLLARCTRQTSRNLHV